MTSSAAEWYFDLFQVAMKVPSCEATLDGLDFKPIEPFPELAHFHINHTGIGGNEVHLGYGPRHEVPCLRSKVPSGSPKGWWEGRKAGRAISRSARCDRKPKMNHDCSGKLCRLRTRVAQRLAKTRQSCLSLL
jgi:hypothetical protein